MNVSDTTVTVSFYGPSIEAWAGIAWGGVVAIPLGYWLFSWVRPDWIAMVVEIAALFAAALPVQAFLEGRSRGTE